MNVIYSEVIYKFGFIFTDIQMFAKFTENVRFTVELDACREILWTEMTNDIPNYTAVTHNNNINNEILLTAMYMQMIRYDFRICTKHQACWFYV